MPCCSQYLYCVRTLPGQPSTNRRHFPCYRRRCTISLPPFALLSSGGTIQDGLWQKKMHFARRLRIRSYGLPANRDRHKHLRKVREALGQFDPPAPKKQPESVDEFMLRVAGIDIGLCPRGRKGRICEVAVLPPVRGPPATGVPDRGPSGRLA